MHGSRAVSARYAQTAYRRRLAAPSRPDSALMRPLPLPRVRLQDSGPRPLAPLVAPPGGQERCLPSNRRRPRAGEHRPLVNKADPVPERAAHSGGALTPGALRHPAHRLSTVPGLRRQRSEVLTTSKDILPVSHGEVDVVGQGRATWASPSLPGSYNAKTVPPQSKECRPSETRTPPIRKASSSAPKPLHGPGQGQPHDTVAVSCECAPCPRRVRGLPGRWHCTQRASSDTTGSWHHPRRTPRA